MYDGTCKEASQIVAGDQVMGDDATPRNVLEVHHGHGPMYKITPSDGGMEWYCTGDHVLVLRSELTREFVEISAQEFSNMPEEEARWLYQLRSYLAYEKLTQEHWAWKPLNYWKHPVAIESAGYMDWTGFSVDGNHRLVLSDFTVVHNSDPAALYGIVRYSIDPTHTLVMMMSTTIQGAKKRVWKTLREYWESVNGLPGKALWSSNEIRGLNYRGDSYGTSSGIYLLAADQSNEKAALDKIIGIKAPRTGEPEDTYEALSARPEYPT